ncbi:MAG: hypothetical protein J2P17_00410 [Mycobacterium sp.]|nr:hypothetical protein [Mycobacterium sp.]
MKRPALADPLEVVGDVVVVRVGWIGWARPLPKLLELVEAVTAQGVAVRSLAEQIDTSSAADVWHYTCSGC